MAARNRARSLKRRNRKFVPSAAGSSRGAILEARISAAALFYRPVDPPLIDANVTDGADVDDDEELNAAQAALTWSVTVDEPWEGPITWQQTSTAVNTLVDVPNPGGSSPVGSATISLSVSINSMQSESGNNWVGFGPPAGNAMVSSVSGDRTYALARSDSSTGANVTLQESFQFTYTGPSGAPGFLAVNDVGTYMAFASPSFGVNWIPGESLQWAVATGSTLSSPPIDTQNAISITVDTPLTLPVQPASIPWEIAYGAAVQTTIVGGNGAANNEVLSMHYSAGFLA
jgi:hypothetical protein